MAECKQPARGVNGKGQQLEPWNKTTPSSQANEGQVRVALVCSGKIEAAEACARAGCFWKRRKSRGAMQISPAMLWQGGGVKHKGQSRLRLELITNGDAAIARNGLTQSLCSVCCRGRPGGSPRRKAAIRGERIPTVAAGKRASKQCSSAVERAKGKGCAGPTTSASDNSHWGRPPGSLKEIGGKNSGRGVRSLRRTTTC